MASHRLVLTKQSRWLPACGCGRWVGVPRRRKRDAELQYRQHVNGMDNPHDPGPRPVTPVDALPELLR